MKTVLPAGKYYIGDPCYVIEGEKWDKFLIPYWGLNQGGVFDFDSIPVCAFATQWGDGCFPASDGSILGVDAGIIGAIPLELCKSGDPTRGTEVEFDSSFSCHREPNGKLWFGDFWVMTNDEDDGEEENDYCPACGSQRQ